MQLGPQRRIRKHPEFQRIQRQGQRLSSAHFVWILCAAAHPEAPSRLGITASRRVGNAVRRNRLKRIVRAAFRREAGMLPNGFDLVVLCRKDDPSLTSDTVVQQWRSLHRHVQKAVAKLRSEPAPS